MYSLLHLVINIFTNRKWLTFPKWFHWIFWSESNNASQYPPRCATINNEIKLISWIDCCLRKPATSWVRNKDDSTVPERHRQQRGFLKLTIIHASVIYQILWIYWIYWIQWNVSSISGQTPIKSLYHLPRRTVKICHFIWVSNLRIIAPFSTTTGDHLTICILFIIVQVSIEVATDSMQSVIRLLTDIIFVSLMHRTILNKIR